MVVQLIWVIPNSWKSSQLGLRYFILIAIILSLLDVLVLEVVIVSYSLQVENYFYFDFLINILFYLYYSNVFNYHINQ